MPLLTALAVLSAGVGVTAAALSKRSNTLPVATAGTAPARSATDPEAESAWHRLVGPGLALPEGPAAPVARPGATVPFAAAIWRVTDTKLPPSLTAYLRSAPLVRVGTRRDGAFISLGATLPAYAPMMPASWPSEPTAVRLPPAYDGQAHASGPSAWIGSVYYGDPTGVGLPLLRAGGFEAQHVSAHFTVADFATRDGAPYTRIAPELVSGLEGMRSILGPITVISGYRHPFYNARPSVGGARYSRHQAGQAADIWSPTESSLAMAQAAVMAMGCRIGIGLGRNTIHVDVRGYLSTWTYRGAPVSRGAFDRWIRQLCGDSAVPPPVLSRATDATWLALFEGDAADAEESLHSAEPEAPVLPPARPAQPADLLLDDQARQTLAGYALASIERDGPGVVVVDLRDQASLSEDTDLVSRARYARIESPEARRLGVDELADWVASQPEGSYFVYALRLQDGRVVRGLAPTTAETVLEPEPEPESAPAPATESQPVEPAQRWFIEVATARSSDVADAILQHYEPRLRRVGLGTSLNVSRSLGRLRYHIVAGPFAREQDARAALGQTVGIVDQDARIVRLPAPR